MSADVLAQLRAAVAGSELAVAGGAVAALLLAAAARWTKLPEVGRPGRASADGRARCAPAAVRRRRRQLAAVGRADRHHST
jgi:hypothetical protein